mgnify:CR=1 FL=1
MSPEPEWLLLLPFPNGGSTALARILLVVADKDHLYVLSGDGNVINNGDNNGNTATEAKVSVTGIPTTPPAASNEGFGISRVFYNLDGTEADLTDVTQNDRFVVTLTVTASEGRNGRLLIVDPLPAGFEIENPNLSFSGDVSRTASFIGMELSVLHRKLEALGHRDRERMVHRSLAGGEVRSSRLAVVLS